MRRLYYEDYDCKENGKETPFTYYDIDDVPTIEPELNSCKYWDSESHFCALRRPQAKSVCRGYWIDTGSGQECSVCHEIQYGYDNFRYYCSNCGAKME